MKNCLSSFLAFSLFLFLGSLLSAQDLSEYYDLSRFYTLDADFRSDDGLARAVTVYLNNGTTEIPLVQVRTPDGKLYSSELSDFNNGHSSRALHSIKTKKDGTVYLYIYTQMGYSVDDGHSTTDGVTVFRPGENGQLERIPIFKTSRAMLDEITCEWESDKSIEYLCYEPYYHSFLDDSATYPGIRFDSKTSTLYVPLIEKNGASDGKVYTNRFLCYHFDGEVFRFTGNQAPAWLHPSLKDYRSTKICLVTGNYQVQYLVQVDELNDGSYRYASWKGAAGRAEMKRKPDLILNNGRFDKEKGYVFQNNTYTYEVDPDALTLTVKNNGQTILKQYSD